MNRMRAYLCLAILLGCNATSWASSENFDTIQVAKDVYAVIAKSSALRAWGTSNTTFIVNENYVVVVDTQMRPSWTYEVVSEIRKVTNKPVRYVIDTHWHRDHTQGNQVYRDVFGPDVTIIQQEFTREDQIKNQNDELKLRPAADIALVEKLLATDRDESGRPLDARGRTRVSNLLAEEKAYLAEVPSIRPTPGDLTFSQKLVLHDQRRDICLYYFGPAHTRGDLVVYLPAERVVMTGDMSQTSVPDMRHAFPLEWAISLKSAMALDWTVNIPGHGGVQRGKEVLKPFASYLDDLVAGVRAAVQKKLTVEQTIDTVRLPDREFIGDSSQKNEAAIRRSYEEISAMTAR